MGFIMNIAVMANDWRKEEFFARKKTYSTSLKNGTYSESDVQEFIKLVKKGKTKAQAGRMSGIPVGSVYHISRCMGI